MDKEPDKSFGLRLLIWDIKLRLKGKTRCIIIEWTISDMLDKSATNFNIFSLFYLLLTVSVNVLLLIIE